MMAQEVKEVRTNEHVINNLTVEEDDSYFETYGHFSIHQEMLQVKRWSTLKKLVETTRTC